MASPYDSLSDEQLLELVEQKRAKKLAEPVGGTDKKPGPLSEARAPKTLAGIVQGGAELVNVFAVPGALETVGRAVFEKKEPGAGFIEGIGQRLEKAEKKTVLPTQAARVESIAPNLRALVQNPLAFIKAPFDDEAYSTARALVKKEAGVQERNVNQEAADVAETVGGLAALVVGGVPLAAKGIAGLKGVMKGAKAASKELAKGAKPTGKSLASLAKEADDVLSDLGKGLPEGAKPKAIARAKTLQRELLGKLPKDVERALFERTENVQNLFNEAMSGTKDVGVYDLVVQGRNQIDEAKNLVGTTIGEFEKVLDDDYVTKFDPDALGSLVNKFRKKTTLSNRESALSGVDQKFVSDIDRLLSGDQMSVGDVRAVMRRLEDRLKPTEIWGGQKSSTQADVLANELWQNMDAAVQDIYPGYKEAKTAYKTLLDDVKVVDQKLSGQNAESFVENLFGANKEQIRGEVQKAFESTKEAVQNIKKVSAEANTVSKKVNAKVVERINALKSQFKDPKFKDAQAFFDAIAERKAARRLTEFGDKDADEAARLIQQYVQPRVDKARGAGAAVSASLAALISRDPVTIGVSSFAGSSLAGGLSRAVLSNVAKRKYSAENLLKQIAKAKGAPSSLQKLANEVANVSKKYGGKAAERFLEAVPATEKEKTFINAYLTTMGGTSQMQRAAMEKLNEEGLIDDVQE